MITTWIIIVAFFGLLGIIALLTRRSSKSSTGSFFRGGGNMLWWMIGASAFMQQFSAWTFTGAQGQAFTHGWQPAFIFLANALGFFVAGFWLAPKVRRMRIVTDGGGLRMRFGKASFYTTTLLTLLSGLFNAAGWMLALGTFVSVVLGVDPWLALLISGLVVTFVSVVGGAKAVIASDFMQSVLIVVISVTASIFALGYSGADLFAQGKGLPIAKEHGLIDVIFGTGYSQVWIPIFWVFMYNIKQVESVSNAAAGRWIAVKDEKDAKKAGLLAGSLMIVGALIWFLPSFHMGADLNGERIDNIVASLPAGTPADTIASIRAAAADHTLGSFSQEIDINGVMTHIKGSDLINSSWGITSKNPMDAIYYAFSKLFMPVGFVGLVVAAIFSATLSSADSYMSRTSGNLTRNIIEPTRQYFIGKTISDKKMVIIGKVLSGVVGAFLTAFSIWMSFGVGQPGKGTSLFDYVIKVSTFIGFPLGIGKILGMYFIRKTPDWGLWVSLIIGATISALFQWVITLDNINSWFSSTLTKDDWAGLSICLLIGLHVIFTGGSLWVSSFFYNEEKMNKRRVLELNKYWSNIDTPIKNKKSTVKDVKEQRKLMAIIGLIMAGGLALMSVIPQAHWWEHLVFFPMAAVLLLMSFLFWKASKKADKEGHAEEIEEDEGQDSEIDSLTMNEYLARYVESQGVDAERRHWKGFKKSSVKE